jgi:hypothetical protein
MKCDRLNDWLFTILRPTQPFTYMKTISDEGLQIFRPMLGAQGIFIVSHMLWHGTSVLPVLSEGPSYIVASSDTQGDAEELF